MSKSQEGHKRKTNNADENQGKGNQLERTKRHAGKEVEVSKTSAIIEQETSEVLHGTHKTQGKDMRETSKRQAKADNRQRRDNQQRRARDMQETSTIRTHALHDRQDKQDAREGQTRCKQEATSKRRASEMQQTSKRHARDERHTSKTDGSDMQRKTRKR